MPPNKTPEEFFSELREATEKEFLKSELKDKGFSFSICGTPIVKNQPIIFGINWGGSNGCAQTHMPTDIEAKEINNYAFIKGLKRCIDDELGIDFVNINFNYTNLCFFRTPAASNLNNLDLECSIPLFKKYIEFIQPPWILSASKSNFNHLRNYLEEINGNVSAKLWSFDIFFVPHPNARISNIKRQEMWLAALNEIKRL
jgi:hypothetical protein